MSTKSCIDCREKDEKNKRFEGKGCEARDGKSRTYTFTGKCMAQHVFYLLNYAIHDFQSQFIG